MFRGHSGVLATWEKAQEMFEDVRVEAEEFIEAGDRVALWYRLAL